ncbi:beta-N-acetylhexosaminidase [Solitalea lacus]|uniref:beta-N-acetylhexosaminidase n=1 Tax=Solitalea lacus TaxID=2911172 RepID=UPI001EDC6B3A|nr:family 20 glycosylhydrolase [Solitalea lacus]UKJ05871.1 family 20 glycosylhydrolase [Solitalea lacus]
MTNKVYRFGLFILMTLFLVSNKLVGQNINIIPYPQKVETGKGNFVFSSHTKIVYDKRNKGLVTAIEPLVTKFKLAAGISLKEETAVVKNNVVKVELTEKVIQQEGYQLSISPKVIHIKAKADIGVFYAVQTLLQLLPADIENEKRVGNRQWKVPAVEIEDAPALAYRGLMMDVARHYMPYEFLEKLIDLLAMQKMNTLHLHLTDSQGWRFESKKYPKLTTIGAYRKGTPLNTTYDYQSRQNDTLYGSFYTQAQLKKLVAYAQSRFITIIPEIEMPAHSKSALASYPELTCLDSTGKAFSYPSQIQDEYCTKDSTFTFLTDILSEVMEIFPSKYIHIAGDEASKVNWRKCPVCQKRMKDEKLTSVEELQSYFIKRIERFVNAKGRSVIGWDEILEGGLAPNATVMSWRGEKGGIEAAKQGHQVIMTPDGYCYFDHYQSDDPAEPAAFGGLSTLAKVYNYKPIPAELSAEEGKLIYGAQGNLWTEYVPNYKQAEYMFFPRSIALAEVIWSANKQPYDQFLSRLLAHLKRLDKHSVNYSRHLFDIKVNAYTDSVSGTLMASVNGIPSGYDVFYTTDGSNPTKKSTPYRGPINITKSSQLIVGVIYNDRLVDKVQRTFLLTKSTGKPSMLTNQASANYNKGGEHAWNNGILGSQSRFNDDEWLGWSGQNFEGTIDFMKKETINKVFVRVFSKPSSWIYMPSSISVLASDNGVDFVKIGEQKDFKIPNDGEQLISLNVSGSARFLKVIASNYGPIPKGNAGEGSPAWLFVNEVIVE